MAVQCGSELELSSTAKLKQSRTPGVLSQHFRDDSLRDDQDLEISVVNVLGREIHREFVHRDTADSATKE
jgi:hypothetical protein